MLKERFTVVSGMVKDGTIQILSRDQNGRVELKIPKVMWMQLTPNDVWGGIQGRFLDVNERTIRSSVLSETSTDVHIEVFL